MCSVWCFSNLFSTTYHGSRGLPAEEESGGSGCECDRGREGEAEEEQASVVPGTKEKGNRGEGWPPGRGGFICSALSVSLERNAVYACVRGVCVSACVLIRLHHRVFLFCFLDLQVFIHGCALMGASFAPVYLNICAICVIITLL